MLGVTAGTSHPPLIGGRTLDENHDDGPSYIEEFACCGKMGKLLSWPSASYVAALADADIQDNQPDPALFAFLQKTLI